MGMFDYVNGIKVINTEHKEEDKRLYINRNFEETEDEED